MNVSKEIESPVGKLTLVANAKALIAVLWEYERAGRVRLASMTRDDQHPILLRAEQQLAEYFAGTRQTFDLPLSAQGTEFQKGVWRELGLIPFGETRSYGEIAERMGKPKAVRAVGAANGRNPLSIIVPCHRVIGARGSLTGFAGGIAAKQFLLRHESRS